MLGPNDYEALGLWLWGVEFFVDVDFFVGVDKVHLVAAGIECHNSVKPVTSYI